jgi:putative FmdB family regulatory protein
MPAYDYECKQCGRRFELRQKMSDPPVETCPQCGGTVERLISGGVGLIFKGSGVHATDDSAARPSCGRDTPCCGRDSVCDSKACEL